MEEQEPNPLKEDPRDFALWKATKPGEDTLLGIALGLEAGPAGTSSARRWPSSFLGPAFEIHGGGLDLVFPHHENELAQSRGAGREFARIWMHNGMLRLTGEKMSKSLGNIATLQEVLDEWGRETLLVFFMTAHWRKPIDFSDETMAQPREPRQKASATRSASRLCETSKCARGATWRRRSTTTSTRQLRSRFCTSGGRPARWLVGRRAIDLRAVPRDVFRRSR